MKMKRFDSSDSNVFKYVFDFGDRVAEAVLYRYGSFEERTVLCVSTQSGCKVGCKFCGTGENFVGNLDAVQIVQQVETIFEDQGLVNINTSCAKLQIMFMSMGEPMLNYKEVEKSMWDLHNAYPNAQLLLSSIGPNVPKDFMRLMVESVRNEKIGLQFSIHKSNDDERDQLIPFEAKMNLNDIRNYGVRWWAATRRKVYLNYCVDGTNNSEEDVELLMMRFPPNVFAFTFSVICSADETMKDAGYRELDTIREFEDRFKEEGYDTRIFDPAGQDDCGGGCGQLWYVQDWMKDRGVGNA